MHIVAYWWRELEINKSENANTDVEWIMDTMFLRQIIEIIGIQK